MSKKPSGYTITFASFELFAPNNGTVLVVLFFCARSVGLATFLFSVESDGSFDGLLRFPQIRSVTSTKPTLGYREDPEFPPETIIQIPQDIIDLVRARAKAEQETSYTGDDDGKIRRGKQHETAISFVGTQRRRGLGRKAIYAILKAYSDECFEPPLSDD